MTSPLKIRLTKKLLQTQTQASKKAVDEDTNVLRDAVLTAHQLSKFYKTYQETANRLGHNTYVMPKDAVQLLSQMQSQNLFVCEKEEKDPNDSNVVAGSILWKHEMPIPSTSPTQINGFDLVYFREIGTQVSVLPGFSFQWILTAIAILEHLNQEPQGILLAATYGDNKVAAGNFQSQMHFAEWKDPYPTWDSCRKHHLSEMGELDRGVLWFRPTPTTVYEAARLFLDIRDNPVRTVSPRIKNPDVQLIELEFDRPAFKQALSYLPDMCRELVDAKPKTHEEFCKVLGNSTVDKNIIMWDVE